jgi:hypothetical protein
MDKTLRDEQRIRALNREKKKQETRSRHRNVSPPPKKIGNLQGSKGFCTFCDPKLSIRLDNQLEIADRIKNSLEEIAAEECVEEIAAEESNS